MPKSLVIVESPAKAKTIQSFLGKEFEVVASFGHVRDLPESADEIPAEFKKVKWAKLGVNVDEGFEPLYVVPGDKRRRVDELKKAAKGADRILLATDEDREGESISWHVLQVIKPAKKVSIERIVFHEVTPEAIQEALATPRQIDTQLVRAQETRRILDRLYGYTLSPLLWRKVSKGLSAGRVQSVAVRLIVIRERERRAFVRARYASMDAKLGAAEGSFVARSLRIDGKKFADGQSFDPTGSLVDSKSVWLSYSEAESLVERLGRAAPWTVTAVETKPGQESPPTPFMTSTLQQEANRKFGFTARKTMQIAQQLYEGIELRGERVGLITYMRTDSLALADRAVQQARDVIAQLYGPEHVPAKAKQYKSKAKNAQEAHEAIRPTDLARKPEDLARYLDADQLKLYDLVWKRTLACQMKPAEVERTRAEVTVEDAGSGYVFGARGKRIVFPGFLRVYVEGSDDPEAELGDREKILPALAVGDRLKLENLQANDHETRPPARYTEASLVEKLESEGVGRPSTYASIIGTIQDRGYVFKKAKELVPTFTAFAVTQVLEENFERLVDTAFTSQMEEELDQISTGDLDAASHLRAFYWGEDSDPGIEPLVQSRAKEIPFPTVEVGENLVVRIGKNGPFIQRGEGGPGNTASVPEDLPPSELTSEAALEILEKRSQGPEAVAVDPSSGQCVFHRTGRFGDYLEVEQTPEEAASKATPRRVTIPPGLRRDELDDATVAALLTFPKTLGKHPESGESVVLAVGRYGAYLSAGAQKANVGEWRSALDMSLEDALRALDSGGKRGASRSAPTAIAEFGTLEGAAGPVRLLEGRYGPYVSDGKTNATLPRGTDPQKVTAEQALELLRAKAAAGPTKKRPSFRKKKR
ncbi:MAG: type I DNA topoisomerase [Fimbriimonadaceae bacterium]|nr:type I DNA topoisomerase [Fimbriimonadaceae bacterium]QYK57646.1 MAG: type I DNA topoisomerase [Fimbriimonadaceae bacterium]